MFRISDYKSCSVVCRPFIYKQIFRTLHLWETMLRSSLSPTVSFSTPRREGIISLSVTGYPQLGNWLKAIPGAHFHWYQKKKEDALTRKQNRETLITALDLTKILQQRSYSCTVLSSPTHQPRQDRVNSLQISTSPHFLCLHPNPAKTACIL